MVDVNYRVLVVTDRVAALPARPHGSACGLIRVRPRPKAGAFFVPEQAVSVGNSPSGTFAFELATRRLTRMAGPSCRNRMRSCKISQ
jgi:hypothetical protein